MKIIIGILLSLLLLLCVNGKATSKAGAPCEGGWETYKDEKCLKIFDVSESYNYDEAESFCREKYDGDLVSIGNEEKQKYLENLLKSHSVTGYIWIGLKYTNDQYQWADGFDFDYTNWATNSPRNKSDYCVQIQLDDSEYGLWGEVLCDQKNTISLCEKVQTWPSAKIQNELINSRYKVKNLIENPAVPINFIYTQLPNQAAPQEVWPQLEWEDVSSQYAGLFFRAVGGNSASFGSTQTEDSPRLKHIHRVETSNAAYDVDVYANNQPSASIDADDSGHRDRALQFTVSDGEVRPRNTAIRVWKRTG